MAATDVEFECDQLPSANAKLELFHAPSFGDEDFQFTLTSSTAAASAISPPLDDASSTSSSLTAHASVDAATALQAPSSPPSMISFDPSDIVGLSDDTKPTQNVVYRSRYVPGDNMINCIRSHDTEYGMPDRKYVTSFFHQHDGAKPSPSSSLNNNNDNENHFRSHPFAASHSMMTLKHYDSLEIPPVTHNHQQQPRLSFDTTSPSACLSNHPLNCEPIDHLQMQYDGGCALVPAATCTYNGGNGVDVSPQTDGSGVCCQSNPLMNGFFPPPRYEATTSSSSPTVKKSKPAKKRKKKDSNEPQKPVSAYALFFRDTQAAIKSHNPNASFGEMSKIVAAMWDTLEDTHKNVYRKRTEVAKKTYLKQLATYRASQLTKDTEEDPSTRKSTGSPTIPDTTTSPGIIAQPPAATSVNQHATTPLSHLSMDAGLRQASAHFTMTSSQCSGVPVTSCYDVYRGATLAGNGNAHMLHQSPDMNLRVYHHGNNVGLQPGMMTDSCSSRGTDGSYICSPTNPIGVRWNYCSPHIASQTQKLDSQQNQSTWWIR